MLFGEVAGRRFFNAPVLSGWWQAASLSLALCLWSDWYEKNYRSAMGAVPPALAHTTCTVSPLQSAGLPPPADSDGEEGLVRGAGGMMVGHYSAAPQDRPPSTLHHNKISLHLIIPSMLIRPSILSSSFTEWCACNYEVEVRGAHSPSLCQITIIIIIIKMIYHHYSVFKQHLVPVF